MSVTIEEFAKLALRPEASISVKKHFLGAFGELMSVEPSWATPELVKTVASAATDQWWAVREYALRTIGFTASKRADLVDEYVVNQVAESVEFRGSGQLAENKKHTPLLIDLAQRVLDSIAEDRPDLMEKFEARKPLVRPTRLAPVPPQSP